MPYADTETVILPLFITLLCMGCAWYEIIKRKETKKGRQIGQDECAELQSLQLKQRKPRKIKHQWTPQTKTIKYSKLQVLGTQTATWCALLFKKRYFSLQLSALKIWLGFCVLKFCSGCFLGEFGFHSKEALCTPSATEQDPLEIKWFALIVVEHPQVVKVVLFSQRFAVSIVSTAGSNECSLASFPLHVASPFLVWPQGTQQLFSILGLHPFLLCLQPVFFTLLMCMCSANTELRGQGFLPPSCDKAHEAAVSVLLVHAATSAVNAVHSQLPSLAPSPNPDVITCILWVSELYNIFRVHKWQNPV